LPIVWLGEKRISRFMGIMFIAVYIVYVGWLYTTMPG
jgi:hypothetical protein